MADREDAMIGNAVPARLDVGQPKWFQLGKTSNGESTFLIHGYCRVASKGASSNGLRHVHADIDALYEGSRLDLGSVQGQVIPLNKSLVADLSVAMTWLADDHHRLRLDFLTNADQPEFFVAYQVWVQTRSPE